MNYMTKDYAEALAKHVLERAMAESPDNFPARFAELWPKYEYAANLMLFSPELAAVRIAEAAERDHNQAEN